MRECPAKTLLAILLALAAAGALPDAHASPLNCRNGLNNLLKNLEKKQARAAKEEYGLEIEVNAAENPNIVLDYRLKDYSEAEWNSFPYKKRVQLALAHRRQYFSIPKEVAYIRLSGTDSSLPEILRTEANGNVEFNGLVFRSHAEAEKFADSFVERYGPASFQGHVARPLRPLPGAAGYSIFEADRAQLQNLEAGYARYLADPNFTPGKNLVHHSLGPLSAADGVKFKRYEAAIEEGREIGNPLNSRLVYGPALRGDAYPEGYVGYELRQYHKRHKDLLAEMKYLGQKLRLKTPLERYWNYSAVELIGSALPQARAGELGIPLQPDWQEFFEQAGHEMRRPSFNAAFGGAPPSERFYFPLRNWAENPIIRALPQKERGPAVARIRKATSRFMTDVNSLVAKGNASAETLKELQILNARWAYEADLSRYFEAFKAKR